MDGIWATLAGLGALAAFSNDESGAGIVLAGATALFAATATRGNGAANECRAAFDEYASMSNSRQQERAFVAEQQVVPQPVAKKKKPKKVEPPPSEPVPEPIADEPPKQEQPIPTPVAPEYTTPRPPPKPTPKKPVSPEDDDWSSFWKELL